MLFANVFIYTTYMCCMVKYKIMHSWHENLKLTTNPINLRKYLGREVRVDLIKYIVASLTHHQYLSLPKKI